MGDPLLKSLESTILRICESNPQGLTDAEVTRQLGSDVKPNHRLHVYNRLLTKGRLRLAERFVGTGDARKRQVLYQWVSAKEAEKFRGLDASDRMVYDLIHKCGQNGATKRDIKFRTNIANSSELKQIVDRLISRGLIKEVKSVQGANKRVYIISELQPSTLHTGGPWYNDEQQFDTEFIEAMYKQVLAYVQRMEYVTVEQVTSYVAEIKLSLSELSQKDIADLMATMVYDGVIEMCQGQGNGVQAYRCVHPTPAVNHLAAVPCGLCPVFRDCSPGGTISPSSCLYMSEWLKQTLEW